MAKKKLKKGAPDGTKLIASNRAARRNYAITDTFEAGLVLLGSEVKSMREAQVQINEGYARIRDGEAWLDGVHVAPYTFAIGFGAHDPDRSRKLLIHRDEIRQLKARVDQERVSLIPLSLYFRDGRVKVEIGIGKGRTKEDKRQAIAERDAKRDAEREMGRLQEGQARWADSPRAVRAFARSSTPTAGRSSICGSAASLTRSWNDPAATSTANSRSTPTSSWWVSTVGRRISVMAGYDGHRGWINYLAVDPPMCRAPATARAMMRAAEDDLLERGARRSTSRSALRTSTLSAFYESIGYTPDDVVSMGRRLIDDERAVRTPDAGFADRRLVELYDMFEGERDDLDHYEAIITGLNATKVLDVGCGTGVLAIRLGERGLDVMGLDPAAASLDIARGKPGADRVRWILGDATALGGSVPPASFDVAVMTGNVAQVFVTDAEWSDVLSGLAAAIRPGGHLVFETRVPEQRAWDEWTAELTSRRVELPGRGGVETWCELTSVEGEQVSFRWSYHFEHDDLTLQSDSTLRFRSRPRIEGTLDAAGFDVVEVRDAPDRPGHEYVFVARRR